MNDDVKQMTVDNLDNAPLILAVDDDLGARTMVRAALENKGFRVSEAENGRTAVEEFRRETPDAVLMDVVMPEMDGFMACRKLRKEPEGKDTPILMMTGLDDIESIHKSFEAGATDFINKPINWTVLIYRIKYMLRASTAFHDVIDKKKEIKKLAYFDHLTGLANRIMFGKMLEQSLEKSQKENTLFAVMFMDLDRFKTINDTLGHHAGDQLLQDVAVRVKNCIRETDSFSPPKEKAPQAPPCFSRQGGDEFTLLLPSLNTPEDAGRIAGRINKSLRMPFDISGQQVFISASIGISIFPLDGSDSQALMKHADLAMYHAKENGKDRFKFYKKELNVKAAERLKFENDVRKAVINGEFCLHYQPQISMIDGSIIGAEALTQWSTPHMGNVPPPKFIPVIEELGLIVPFTDWVIREAGKQQLSWIQERVDPVRIAVNISSKHFVDQAIPDKMIHILERHRLNPELIELELTESVLADRDGETLDILNMLKEIGLRISVDDFGTGYSSLTYLKTLPVDVVKIDRFFITDLLNSPKDAAIVKAMIDMSHSMDMKVVAEGIETREQFERLQKMGCDYGQGYLFSPAVKGETFTTMLSGPSPFQFHV